MSTVRPLTNQRSNPTPVDDDLELALVLSYTLDSGGNPVPTASSTGASVQRKILDYDERTDGNPVYVGTNTQTALIAGTDWVIQKLFYDASSRLIDAQVLTGAWSGRAALSWRSAAGN